MSTATDVASVALEAARMLLSLAGTEEAARELLSQAAVERGRLSADMTELAIYDPSTGEPR
jgi:hypothetical protein